MDPGQICKPFSYWSEPRSIVQQKTLNVNVAALSTPHTVGGNAETSSLLREQKTSSEKQKLSLKKHWDWEERNNLPGLPFPFCTLKMLGICQHGMYY